MSQNSKLTRTYPWSDASLKQRIDTVLRCVERDSAAFATRAVDASTVASLRTAVAAFADTPTDEELVGGHSVAVAEKDSRAEDLRVALRTLRTMALNCWGDHDARYRSWGFERLSRLGDEDLLRLGRRSVRIGTAYLPVLAAEGLTPPQLASLDERCVIFDTGIDAALDAKSAREIQTQERILRGNALHRELLRICNIGRDLWASLDEARFNDYQIATDRG